MHINFPGLFVSLCLFVFSSLMGQAQSSRLASKPTTFALSRIDTIPSTILGENRVLNVYLPDGYSPDSATKYPVIYLLDGGVDEDFVHIVGLVMYNTTPWINRFPQSIVVGIGNVNRRRDFTFAVPNLDFVAKTGFDKSQFSAYGGSAKFIAFLEQEVQPFIDKRYATSKARTIIGESLAGLLATEILLKKPALFDTYIIMSPSLWWGQESLLHDAPRLLAAKGLNPVNVYIGACEKASSVRMYTDAKALSAIVTKHGAGKARVYFDYLPGETHATLIHQSVYNAFKLLYPLKK